MTNCKLILSLIFLMLSNVLLAQKKWQWGVGIDMFQTQLNNVDRENFSGYGHSVPGFTQNDRLGFGATFLMQCPIYKNLHFETGVGISNFRSQFKFDYIRNLAGISIPIDRQLDISLYYLRLPLFATYNLRLSPHSTINISLGVNTKFLFAHYDNYQKILVEFIGGQSGIYRYDRLIAAPEIRIGFSKQLNGQNSIRLESFYGFDTEKFVGNRGWWGFYGNLSTAHYSYYGASLKYFFTLLNG